MPAHLLSGVLPMPSCSLHPYRQTFLCLPRDILRAAPHLACAFQNLSPPTFCLYLRQDTSPSAPLNRPFTKLRAHSTHSCPIGTQEPTSLCLPHLAGVSGMIVPPNSQCGAPPVLSSFHVRTSVLTFS